MSTFKQLDALVALITSNVETVKKEYERAGVPAPDLDDTKPHPLDGVESSIVLKQAQQVIEGACAQLSVLVNAPQHTMCNHMETASLNVVIQANVVDHLKGHPEGLHVSELSKKTGIEQGKLARVLRLLATRHCFREVSDNVFANNRLSIVLGTDHGMYYTLAHWIDEGASFSTKLAEVLNDPEWGPSYDYNKSCFNRYTGYGEPLFIYYDVVNKELGARFGKAMIGYNAGIGAGALLTGFPWKELPAGTTLCDVGGGVGNVSMRLAKTFPQLSIVLQDLGVQIDQAKEIWSKEAPEVVEQQRVSFVPFDFFKESPASDCDIYYLKNIIHDWPDAQAKQILENVKKVMKPGSRLLIQEYVLQHLNRSADSLIPVAPEPLLPNYGLGRIREYYQDLNMMVCLNAKERTLDDFTSLANDTGFKFVKLWDFGETAAIEFKKAE
ncbi:S-adenosyl-L-methionine-dependent methyltransferase [Punctularia strigosozonata HHB-11173 SS5]|uniref:S-adenosyl-L-methionine-dependent methyltransferase n=1 Tax=Punctularia strigosozonata (strain HHB-11173) TaxID=741275 RepID=UPI0004416884|nr:S-adenosyl-L-methionine-dependent methyltransferase [Punctularia strigosozonata HHB-11173 SS5]EIN06884.1 S-adenosyl-L-methionine-dependent methyltransferase [Punctularia strigosozonata HHB-11173 SS5]